MDCYGLFHVKICEVVYQVCGSRCSCDSCGSGVPEDPAVCDIPLRLSTTVWFVASRFARDFQFPVQTWDNTIGFSAARLRHLVWLNSRPDIGSRLRRYCEAPDWQNIMQDKYKDDKEVEWIL